jgi:hypothetical protein
MLIHGVGNEWLDGNGSIHYGDTETEPVTKLGAMMKRSCFTGLLIAWVLWIRTQGLTMDDWTQQVGFISEAQCAISMKEKLDVWRPFKDAKFTANTVTFTENKTTMSYICLPDTEDPRKGKTPKKEK